MTPETMEFGKSLITRDDIFGKRVIEIGSYNVNGSYATFLKPFNPEEYVACDLQPCNHNDKCVNLVIDAVDLLNKFGKDSFDYVICTEMLEHAKYWKKVISVMKNLVKPNGYLVLTTRSPGFPLHSYPDDWWRFTYENMKAIFSDCKILNLATEKSCPGVFIRVRKPANFTERILDMHVYSMKPNMHVYPIKSNTILIL